jgi:hypothetical protein
MMLGWSGRVGFSVWNGGLPIGCVQSLQYLFEHLLTI